MTHSSGDKADSILTSQDSTFRHPFQAYTRCNLVP
jgi:hypothetical protein